MIRVLQEDYDPKLDTGMIGDETIAEAEYFFATL